MNLDRFYIFTGMQQPPGRNMSPEQRQREVESALQLLPEWQAALEEIARQRARDLLEDHRRVRDAARAKGSYEVRPQLPVDVLGLYVLMPEPKLF